MRFVENWRPMSLLNVNVNIASKAPAIPVQSVINTLIGHNLIAYVSGRFIDKSIRLIDEILEYTNQKNEDAIIFTADIEKAFGSVKHATLKKISYPRSYLGIFSAKST